MGVFNRPLVTTHFTVSVFKQATMEVSDINKSDLRPIEFSEQEKRCAIIMAIVNSNHATCREISEMLGVHLRTVQILKKRLEEGKDPRAIIQRVPKTLQVKRKARDPGFIAKLEQMLEECPSINQTTIARQLNVDNTTVRKCLEEDLRSKSYRIQTAQPWVEGSKDKRLAKCVKLLSKYSRDDNMLWFFSDEKNFCQDQVFNRQNRWLAMGSKDVVKLMKTELEDTVTVFGVISSDGDIMPPHIIETGVRVDTDVYLDVLSSVVFPWIEKVAHGRPWVWQQDKSQCHVSDKTIDWLKENAYDFVDKETWPPNSPDLNPVDYFFWGVLEAKINRRRHDNKASLMESIRREATNMGSELVRKACRQFRRRVEQVIETEGSYVD